jgi:sterol desaturase/sphingolipid hydroxylase (fatty acid hydroxylase superfamily)
MPTPIEVLSDPVSIATIAIYLGLIGWENIAPAEKLAPARFWPLRGLIAFALYFYVATYLPLIWGNWLAPLQLFDLSRVQPAIAAMGGLLAFEFALYWWHRGMHETNLLWRIFHQMHHSADGWIRSARFISAPWI